MDPLDDCGCCDGVRAATPRRHLNRPGLSQLDYRVGDYGSFRQSLIAGLAATPALKRLSTRDSADFSLALIDALACSAEVLASYQQSLAQEQYLRTAAERVSLQELGRLVGYRLRPGVAAETALAFALETPRPAPPSNEPGGFVTGIPERVLLPAGLAVQSVPSSVPGPDELPQVFETVEALDARPEWNGLALRADAVRAPRLGDREAWLAGTATRLQAGDWLLFVGPEFAANPASNRWDVRQLLTVEPDHVAQRTRVTWAQGLGSLAPSSAPSGQPQIHALRSRAAVFGHNAPDWPGMSNEFKAAYLGLDKPEQLTPAQKLEWPRYDIHGPSAAADPQAVPISISAQDAAKILREGVAADAMAAMRGGLSSLAGAAGAVGSLVESGIQLPGLAARHGIEALQLLPGAAGQVLFKVMEPIQVLVQNAIGNLQTWGSGVQGTLGAILGVLNPVAGAVAVLTGGNAPNPLGLNGGLSFGAINLGPNNLIVGNPLSELQTKLGDAVQELRDALTGLVEDGVALRNAQAAVVEQALANAAMGAYAARMEAELQLSPRLPQASGGSVGFSALMASAQARDLLPDLVVATALSDPRPGALLLASALAAEVDPQNNPDLPLLTQLMLQDTQTLATQAAQLLRQPQAQNLMAVAGQARQMLLQAGSVGGNFGAALGRLRSAAASAVQRAHLALEERLDRMNVAADGRRFALRLPDTISLDRVYPELQAGSLLLLRGPDYLELYRVDAVAERSRAEFGLSGKSSVASLRGENLLRFRNQVRELSVHLHSEPLALAPAPLTQPFSGAWVELADAAVPLPPPLPPLQRRVIVQGQGADGAPLRHLAQVVQHDAGTPRRLRLEPPLPRPLKRAGALLFANVAWARHGETASQILGNGDGLRPHARYELQRQPLTHRAAAVESGALPEIEVRVGERAWARVDSLYGAGPDAEVYSLETDVHGRLWVQFGDGLQGARAPTGQANLRLRSRKGLGLAGNVAADRLSQPMSRPPGLKAVSNPLAALGGAEPESLAAARRSLPLVTRTLGRVVSRLDYEDYALAFAGVAQAQARLLLLGGRPSMVLALVGAQGEVIGPQHPTGAALLQALRQAGEAQLPLRLVAYRPQSFRLALRVRVDAAYETQAVHTALRAALLAQFNPLARRLGQPLFAAELLAEAQGLPGVLALDLERLHRSDQPAALQNRLLADPLHLAEDGLHPPELLGLHAAGIAPLESF